MEPFVYTFDGEVLAVAAAEAEFRAWYRDLESEEPNLRTLRSLRADVPAYREAFNGFVDNVIRSGDWIDARDFDKCDPAFVSGWLAGEGRAYYCEDCADYAIAEGGFMAMEDSDGELWECAHCDRAVRHYYVLEH